MGGDIGGNDCSLQRLVSCLRVSVGRRVRGLRASESAAESGKRHHHGGHKGRRRKTEIRPRSDAECDYIFLYVLGSLCEVLWLAKIAPIIFIGTEGEDFLLLGGEAQIGSNDGECAVLDHHGKETRRDYVYSGEGQGQHLRTISEKFWPLVSGLTTTKTELLVEQQIAGGFAVLHGERR